MATSKVKISVIIPTLDRPRRVASTVRYFLEKENDQVMEVIVVDQSEKRNEELHAMAENSDGKLCLLEVAYRNVSRARNDGARKASGKILVFVDDDIEPADGFVRGHTDTLSANDHSFVTGAVLETGEKLRGRENLAELEKEQLEQGTAYIRDASFPYETAWCGGANLSCYRKAFFDVGGFDERLYRFYEDSEFSHRVKDNGYRILFSPDPVVLHTKEPTGGNRRDRYTAEYARAFFDNLAYFNMAVGAGVRWQFKTFLGTLRELLRQRKKSLLSYTTLRYAWFYMKGMVAGMKRARHRGEGIGWGSG